jgi:triosephosphate isomerase
MAGYMVSPSAQNCHFAASGAYTGEVSVDMIKSVGALYCIAGHSERRQLFHEGNEVVKAKVDAILNGGLTPIFCCGEALDIREAGGQNDFVRSQLEEGVFHLEPDAFSRIIIAYEPIWAIGTGVTASPGQAQEMHAFIRETIRSKYGVAIGDTVRILYGGSIKGDNAGTLFGQPDVDGGLVGGASLQAGGFLDIIRAAC